MKTLILFTFLLSVPPWVADEVRCAFARWASYEAFATQEQPLEEADRVAIRVDWQPLAGNTLGEAYSIQWGHPHNRIVLDSTGDWNKRDDLLLQVALHEIGHILLQHHHTWGDPTALMGPSTWWRVVRLSWTEQHGLMSRYGQVRPIPQEPSGAWR